MAHYRINDISDNAEFFITREKIRVSVDVSYERVFVEAEKANIIFAKIEAQNARQLQKRFKQDCFAELLYMPLIISPVTTIAFLFLGLF